MMDKEQICPVCGEFYLFAYYAKKLEQYVHSVTKDCVITDGKHYTVTRVPVVVEAT
jgi:hypothetical protein